MIPQSIQKEVAECVRNESIGEDKVQDLKDFGEIEIVLLSGYKDPNYPIWRSMMEARHYLHSSNMFGQQIKYLVSSSRYGWIGGLGFGSASWQLKPRDERLCWSKEEKREGLKKVVCNNRFLILPEYGVKNLASYVLSRSIKRLTDDWELRYRVRPVLVESFVDSEKFEGTCYKASNWQLLGKTQGRGRNDREHENKLSKKYIFAYELEKGILSEVTKKEEEGDWVSREYKYAELPNKAKKDRLIQLTRDFFEKPASPLTICCEGQAKLKGAYRFFSDINVKPEAILNSHIKQTIERARGHKVVLAVNDTTSFNHSTHNSTTGLGCLSSGEGELGYLLHDTVLFTTEGIPLGVLDAQTWSRDVSEHGKRKERRNKPIEEKESYKWLKSFKAMAKAQEEAPGVMFVSVGDREADVYELYELAAKTGEKYVVRSSQNRRTTEDAKVWDLVEKQNPAGKVKVRVRDKDKKYREVELEIRFRKVRLRVPGDKKKSEELTLWAISAKEILASKGKEALHWKLFTNIEVSEFEQACEKVEWYSIRFGVETFHRILKSGRRSEDKRLGSLDRLERCLAIDMITAWRLMYLTMSGRETPNASSEFFFNKDEIEVLKILKNRSNYKTNDLMPLKDAVMMIAILGGFVQGKDRVPGVEVMWRGIRRLGDIVLGATLIKGVIPKTYLPANNPDYG